MKNPVIYIRQLLSVRLSLWIVLFATLIFMGRNTVGSFSTALSTSVLLKGSLTIGDGGEGGDSGNLSS